MTTRSAALALSLIASMLLTACGDKPEHALLGTWELVGEEYGLRMVFRADGRYLAMTPGKTHQGWWELQPPDRIATWSDPGRPKRVNRFELREDRLLIHVDGERVREHRRVAREADPR